MPTIAQPSAKSARRAAARHRRGALVACLLGSVLVNAAALVAGQSVSGSGLTPTTKPVASPNRALLLVPPRSAIDDVASTATVAMSAPPDSVAVPAAKRRADAPLAWAKGIEAQPPSEQPIRFYRFTEVDRPADPETDWAIEPEALDKLGLQRLAFEVLISDSGEIIGCTILDPIELASDVRDELESRLRTTPMHPAVRAGQLVASVRRIELYLTAEGQ